MHPSEQDRFRLGDCTVTVSEGTIARADVSTRLEPKVMQLLVYLCRHHGRVVSRGELLEAVWPGVSVEGVALARSMVAIRRALGDTARQSTYIETLHRRGYRLIAPIAPAEASAAPPVSARRRWLIPAAASIVIGLGFSLEPTGALVTAAVLLALAGAYATTIQRASPRLR